MENYVVLNELISGGEGDDRGWDGWMISPTWWTWIWARFGNWWWTGKPGLLQSTGSQRVRHHWATELNWKVSLFLLLILLTTGERNGSSLQYSCLENPLERGAWWVTVHGVAKSQTRLSMHAIHLIMIISFLLFLLWPLLNFDNSLFPTCYLRTNTPYKFPHPSPWFLSRLSPLWG